MTLPYMKGAGPDQDLFRSIVPKPPVGVLHEGARRRGAGVNVGRYPPKVVALTPAASGASCLRTPMWCCEFPSLLELVCDGPVGSQRFIRRSPHMMGFGHVPTGSIRTSATPGGRPRRTSSTRRSVAETQAGLSRHRTSPSRIAYKTRVKSLRAIATRALYSSRRSALRRTYWRRRASLRRHRPPPGR